MVSNPHLGFPTHVEALLPQAPTRQRLGWERARRAFNELMADPDDTQKAMDLNYAIGAGDFERIVQRFAASFDGRRLLIERPCLAQALSARSALEALPDDSLGRAYLAYLDANGFQATALIDLQKGVQARWEAEEGAPPIDPVRQWVHERLLLCHDLFHVLTDYDTGGIGEATLLAFSLGQNRGVAGAFLTLGAALEVWRHQGRRWLVYDFRAWRRGRVAAWLVALPWEELLGLPLESVRRMAGVADARDVHPGGIWRGEPNSAVA